MDVAKVPDATPYAANEVRIGQLPPDIFPNGLERSARTSGTVATKLPMDADILLDSGDDSPNPPVPVERIACDIWWGCSVNRFAGHPSSKTDDSSAVPGSSRRRSSIHIALVSAR